MNPYQPPRHGPVATKRTRSWTGVIVGYVFIAFGILLLLSSLRTLLTMASISLPGSTSYSMGYAGGSLMVAAIAILLIIRGLKKVKP